MNEDVRILSAGQGELIGVAGSNYRVLASKAETNGAFATLDMLIPPGGGPPPHSHPNMQEWFFVIDGELEFKTEAGKTVVGKGGFVHIPLGGAVHCFKNISASDARVLCTVLPSGLEELFKEIGVPVKEGEFPSPVEITPELRQRLDSLNRQFEQTIYPIDYLD